jgi:hypothetical protein
LKKFKAEPFPALIGIDINVLLKADLMSYRPELVEIKPEPFLSVIPPAPKADYDQ